ncbi:hypothetical protein [Domibacillus epiphyticus]|uniref:Uncharacterized protein n=1 Tax=Domibacillus epiphyticus TaxID=1714355 RepID=A0A1V2A7S8_9BACI|nr:hypothetical protein [Domibacillus epiphyticus]OMP67063.1 hypothetical protein BTO28_08760 [Domibacillus epiphyticus]
MTSLKSYSELDMLNILITMCFAEKLPNSDNIFHQEGYRIISIDRTIQTSSGSIKYDLVLSSVSKNVTLCFELKGFKASNLSNDQLDRYKGLATDEYIGLAGISSPNSMNHELQTIIGINIENAIRVENYQIKEGYSFPILNFGSKSISLSFRSLKDTQLDERLLKSLSMQEKHPVFIYFDKESSLSDLAYRIIPKVFSYAKVDELTFTVDQIIDDVYCSVKELHRIIGPDVKKAVINKIKQLLKKMSQEEYKDFLSWDSKQQRWNILKINSESHHVTDMAYQRAAGTFIERLKSGAPFTIDKVVPEGQLSIFDFEEDIEHSL